MEDSTQDSARREQYQATVGLVSDTHGWLDPDLLDVFREHAVDRIVHAGDIGDEAILDELEQVAPVTAVKGNIDGGDLRFLAEEEVVEVAGKDIAVLHIAGSPRRPRRRAIEFVEREQPDAIIVGHSHIPVVGRVRDALWINPGAAGRQGFHNERFAAMLHVDGAGEFQMDRVHLGARTRSAAERAAREEADETSDDGGAAE